VYLDPAAPVRSISLLDGFNQVSNSAALTFPVGGFRVPAAGAVRATLDVVAYEGDRGNPGDTLTVGSTVLSNAVNPANDVFNSTAATDTGEQRPGLFPGYLNLLGLDIDRFDITRALDPGSTSTTIRFGTSGDRYLTGLLAIAVDQ
jgi:hypothetical protein